MNSSPYSVDLIGPYRTKTGIFASREWRGAVFAFVNNHIGLTTSRPDGFPVILLFKFKANYLINEFKGGT